LPNNRIAEYTNRQKRACIAAHHGKLPIRANYQFKINRLSHEGASSMKRFLIGLAITIIVLLVLLIGGLTGVYFWASSDLPDFKRITDYNPSLVTTVYARDGRVLGYFSKEKRFLVGLREISPFIPQAFLASEDSNFYSHEGVDFSGIVRAALKNVQAGGIVQGGSTVTQQVIKSLLLTPERSYVRKIKEVILAYRLERYLSKDEILTIYLNQIFLGSRAYGVEAAAREYFGKHASELTLAECALLAGLPQAPSRYSPYSNPDAAKLRQQYVLRQMLSLGWIDEEQHREALEEPLLYTSMEDPSWKSGAYFLEEVRRWLISRYGEEAVLSGGLHVYTTMDFDHQIAAEKALRKGLEDSAKRRGWQGPIRHLTPDQYGEFLRPEGQTRAHPEELPRSGSWIKVLVAEVEPGGARTAFGNYAGWIDVSTMTWARKPDPGLATEEVPSIKDAREVLRPGDVVWASILSGPEKPGGQWSLGLEQEPLVEGALVSIEPDTGHVVALVGGYDFARSQFNRATQAWRQPGSAFKPIVYSVALDNGYTAASIVLDAPIVFEDLETELLWKPENFEGIFYGPTLIRNALIKSRNLVTIRVAQRLGISRIIERARGMGLTGSLPSDLSVSLGSGSVTPIGICQAFTAFARGGDYITPSLVLRVTEAWGGLLYEAQPEVVEAISPQTAYIINYLLKDVVQEGTGWRAKALGRPVAGKTGTTNDEQDAWFIGYTPTLLSGVFVGFDQLQPMGKYETGSRAASPIWLDYRSAVESNYPVKDFLQPPEIVMAQIDARTGLLAVPGSGESYFLPFKAGTQPVETAPVAEGLDEMGQPRTSGEDLLKQIF
jgi:penicillin-binding protein 1A